MTKVLRHHPKFDLEQVQTRFDASRNEIHGYFDGLLRGRPDPGVRAIYVRYDEEAEDFRFRSFSYDELVVTAHLIHCGTHPVRAAALAREERVVAGVLGKPTWVKTGLDYQLADEVCFPDGSKWGIGVSNASGDCPYIDQYIVWYLVNGEILEARNASFPSDLFFTCETDRNLFRQTTGDDLPLSTQVDPDADVPLISYELYNIKWGNPAGKPAQMEMHVPVQFVAERWLGLPGADARLDGFIDQLLAIRYGETPTYAFKCLEDINFVIR